MAVIGGVKDFTADVFDFFETPRNENGNNGTHAKGKVGKSPEININKAGIPDSSNRGKFKRSGSRSSTSDSESEIETESLSSYKGKKRDGNDTPVNVKGERYSSDSFSDSDSSSAFSKSSKSVSSSSNSEDELIETEREKFHQQQLEKRSKNKRPSDLEKYHSEAVDTCKKNVREAWSTTGISKIDIHKKEMHSDSERQFQARPKSSKLRGRDSQNNTAKNIKFSDSDSEMTDVSPLASPRNKKDENQSVLKNGVQYDEEKSCVKLENSKLDLSVLMEAVGEIERERARNERLKGNSRRVMFAPPKSKQQKANYTYDANRTKSIEKENQRLLKEIMRHISPKQKQIKFRPENVATQRLTTSAVNRRKEQQRIESENLAILKRLHGTKSSKGMSRNEQLTEYQKVRLYGVPMVAVHPVDGETTALSRTRSVSSMVSASTSGTRRSRPSSAKSNASTLRSRPSSAKSTTSTLRPGSAKSGRSLCSAASFASLKQKGSTSDLRPPWDDRFAYS